MVWGTSCSAPRWSWAQWSYCSPSSMRSSELRDPLVLVVALAILVLGLLALIEGVIYLAFHQ